MIERFMSDLSREYGRDSKRLTREALATLRAHPWPGNVRQLRNLVERLVLTVPTDEVGLAELPEDFGGEGRPDEDLYGEFDTLAAGIEAFERYHLRRALAEADGDEKSAATTLGLTKREMLRRLRR